MVTAPYFWEWLNEEPETLLSNSSGYMKLLFIVPSRGRGGAEEYCLKIASGAVQRGWEVHAAVPRTNGTDSIIQDFRAIGIVHHSLNIPEEHYLRLEEENELSHAASRDLNNRVLGWLHRVERNVHRAMDTLQQFTRTTSVLRKARPDVVLVSLPWSTFGLGIILACGFLQIPTAVVFHMSPFPFWIRPSKVKAYNWARSRNQKWITVSEYNRKLMCASFQIPHQDVFRIYNGLRATSTLEERDCKDTSDLRRQVREELALPQTAQLLLTVARLEPHKGHDYLIPTISHIINEFKDVRFEREGEGQQKDFLMEKLKEYRIAEEVLLLGYRSDVSRLMQSADLFVFPTYYEGHPFSLLEAMMHGLPIVSADASGIPELIEHKVHGVLSRTGDSCDLLEAIRWALRHPDRMREMAKNAKLRVLEFSEEKMIEQTLEVLRDLNHTREREP